MKKINIEEKISDYKNKYNGERCFIVGNGPSLNHTNMNLLKNEYTFALNQINLIYDKYDWRPSVYCSFSNRVEKKWRDNILYNIKNLNVPIFLCKDYEKIIPNETKINFIETIGTSICDSEDSSQFNVNIEKYVTKHGSTLLSVLEVAIYMGFKEIYFIGTDLGYDKKITHFDENYLKLSNPSRYNNDILNTHKLINNNIKQYNVKIYNATIGGDLEEYERVNFNELLKK